MCVPCRHPSGALIQIKCQPCLSRADPPLHSGPAQRHDDRQRRACSGLCSAPTARGMCSLASLLVLGRQARRDPKVRPTYNRFEDRSDAAAERAVPPAPTCKPGHSGGSGTRSLPRPRGWVPVCAVGHARLSRRALFGRSDQMAKLVANAFPELNKLESHRGHTLL